MNTLYLDDDWDLAVDASGNIAMAQSSYAIAQDVASSALLWKGEHIYDTTRGIPYRNAVLGQRPSVSMLADWYTTEGLTVPETKTINCVFSFDNRSLTGQLQIETTTGETINVGIS